MTVDVPRDPSRQQEQWLRYPGLHGHGFCRHRVGHAIGVHGPFVLNPLYLGMVHLAIDQYDHRGWFTRLRLPPGVRAGLLDADEVVELLTWLVGGVPDRRGLPR